MNQNEIRVDITYTVNLGEYENIKITLGETLPIVDSTERTVKGENKAVEARKLLSDQLIEEAITKGEEIRNTIDKYKMNKPKKRKNKYIKQKRIK